MLDNLKIFICAAEQKSLTRAAQSLGLTIAMVSRRVGDLERQLGCELFHRSTKGLTLTPAGVSYFDECADFINALDQRLSNLDATLHGLDGELNVMMPMNLGSGPLDEFWQEFIRKYPRIRLRIRLSDPADDVIVRQVDIALRSGEQRNSSLIQKHLGGVEVMLVAAAGSVPLPADLQQLNECSSIAADLFSDWLLVSGERTVNIHKQHQHMSNDLRVIANMVKAGAGIALLPLSIIHRELKRGELVRVLPQWQGVRRDLYLVWPYQHTLSARARLFHDELIAFLGDQPWFKTA